jgi:LmbE family N-acetylglucosaminyl deacetylase
MATLVAFHAHPDDECIGQSGTLAKATAAGHRVVVVYATGGELGAVPDGFLAPGETLVERRAAEARRSADVLGVDRVLWLGYRDSGMMGEPGNDDPRSFWRADVDEAAARLAEVVRAEGADVLTVYDEKGQYGHPDHIQVHRVGVRAGELAGTPHVLELTFNRDHIKRMMAAAGAGSGMPREDASSGDGRDEPGGSGGDGPERPAGATDELGMPEEAITTFVDVGGFLDRKRASMEAHASQIADTRFLLAMPPEAFAFALGTEFYIRRGAPPGHRDDDVFAGVDGT